ncbi:hypothetical protein Nepgr_023760 [Nepenthes gracilis]|uniref:Uncharacterized protein n=1 Tax=Nepenthes gracilis TaxID=150966 RepID=A0AAD3T4I2_NEPGR|nr:hypothetical protein Nepgr_023760 [Nepenthes gracilis]
MAVFRDVGFASFELDQFLSNFHRSQIWEGVAGGKNVFDVFANEGFWQRLENKQRGRRHRCSSGHREVTVG